MPVLRADWTRLRPREVPYRWLATGPGDLLDRSTAELLTETFPVRSFVPVDKSAGGGDKQYRNSSRTVVAPDGRRDTLLPEPWLRLVDELLAPGYRQAVARLLVLPVAETLEIRLVRHGPGDWMGPHTDRPDKLFSHIVYLARRWHPDWGGHLEILGSADPADVVDRVVPLPGSSALLARADNSWHQVGRVTAAAVGVERRSLLVHGLCRP